MPWYINTYIDMTREKYPDFEIKIWGEKDFNPKTVPYTSRALDAQKWAFISDYLRVKILHEEGGVYLDTDMVPINDMRPLLKNSIVIGWEYNKLVSTGFTAAIPGHPFFRKILDAYEGFKPEDNDYNFLVNNELWTYELKNSYGLKLDGKQQLLLGDIMIYPQDHFAEMKVSDNSIFLHDHKLSWTSPTKQVIMKNGLQAVRKTQKFISPLLSIATYIQFRSNKKAINKVEKEVVDENTKNIKK